jgi:hypothetical protein
MFREKPGGEVKTEGSNLLTMKPGSDPLRFRGMPTLLTATVDVKSFPEAVPTWQVNLPGVLSQPLPVRPVFRRDLNTSTLRFRLPRFTPPGTYPGTVEVSGQSLPISVEVEARSELRLIPHSLRIKTKSAGKVSVDLTLQNLGNLPFLVESKHTFCLYDGSGVDQAFFAALVEEIPEGMRRIDRLLDKLAESHGGLVRVIVEKGAGEVPPGGSREMRVSFHFSNRLRENHLYSGYWSFSNFQYLVEVEVIGEKSQREEAR